MQKGKLGQTSSTSPRVQFLSLGTAHQWYVAKQEVSRMSQDITGDVHPIPQPAGPFSFCRQSCHLMNHYQPSSSARNPPHDFEPGDFCIAIYCH